MNNPDLKQDILKIIYPCTAANYFQVDNTSYLYRQADEIAEKVVIFISSNPLLNEIAPARKFWLSEERSSGYKEGWSACLDAHGLEQ